MKYSWKVDNKMGHSGETNEKDRVVKVNKKRSHYKTGKVVTYAGKKLKPSIINTIVHEKMHVDHPKMTEKAVYKKTPILVKGLNKQEKARMYNLLKK